jgi:hypothetical protein
LFPFAEEMTTGLVGPGTMTVGPSGAAFALLETDAAAAPAMALVFTKSRRVSPRFMSPSRPAMQAHFAPRSNVYRQGCWFFAIPER